MIQTEVYRTGEQRFDPDGRSLGFPVQLLDERISQGMARRLVRYAERRMREAGLQHALQWTVTVSCDDVAHTNRTYHVSWTNAQRTQLTVEGIYTRAGWPFIDHGFAIATGQ